MASYPETIPSFTTKVDQVDINWAAHVNRLQDELRAIATELGVLPKGSSASVRSRFETFELSKASADHNHDASYWQRTLITAKGEILAGTGEKNLQPVAAAANGRVLLSDTTALAGVRFDTLTHSVFSDLGDDHYSQYARADGSRGAFLPLAGGEMLGPVVLNGHREKLLALGSVSGGVTLPIGEETAITLTATGNLEVFFEDATFPADEVVTVSVLLTQGGTGSYSSLWPASVTWVGSGPPAANGVGEVTLVSFSSFDGGATWIGISLLEY